MPVTSPEFRILENQIWLHKNGRVNATVAGNNWVGVSVSPYMKDFKYQVDPGIWPLVEILNKKGYLTCSSCEGHDWMEESFVVVCFGCVTFQLLFRS